MKLYLFDDGTADEWFPFALTRPVGELRFGVPLLRERVERWAGLPASGHLTRPWLRRYREAGAPPAVSPHEVGSEEARLFLSSRFVPSGTLPRRLRAERDRDGSGDGSPGGPALLRAADRVVGALLPAGAPSPGADWLRAPSSDGGPEAGEALVLEGSVLERPWDLVDANPERLANDIARAAGLGPRPGGGSDAATEGGATGPGIREAPSAADTLPPGVHRLGDGPVLLGTDVRLEPGTLLDTRAGGVWLDDAVEVRAGCRLEGPLYAGPRSRLLGGPLSAVAAGPFSYLRGEIEETVVLGYVNKAHSGFLGHAYLGRWVNLGASTTNSDLKNNYGPVRVGPPGGTRDTGLLKLGCLVGDHAKTGIGTLLNTGTVVGAGSSLFGGAMPPKWVPPFSWGAGGELSEYRRDAFLETAAAVMGRRGVELDEETRAWLAATWEEGRRVVPEDRGSAVAGR